MKKLKNLIMILLLIMIGNFAISPTILAYTPKSDLVPLSPFSLSNNGCNFNDLKTSYTSFIPDPNLSDDKVDIVNDAKHVYDTPNSALIVSSSHQADYPFTSIATYQIVFTHDASYIDLFYAYERISGGHNVIFKARKISNLPDNSNPRFYTVTVTPKKINNVCQLVATNALTTTMTNASLSYEYRFLTFSYSSFGSYNPIFLNSFDTTYPQAYSGYRPPAIWQPPILWQPDFVWQLKNNYFTTLWRLNNPADIPLQNFQFQHSIYKKNENNDYVLIDTAFYSSFEKSRYHFEDPADYKIEILPVPLSPVLFPSNLERDPAVFYISLEDFSAVGGVGTPNFEVNESITNLNTSITNSNSSGAQDDAGNFFSGFQTNTHGLTGIITAPLNLIQSITNQSCSPVSIPLPFVNKNLELPCMSTIYQQTFGGFLTLYQTITTGVISYWVVVRIFALVKDFKNPEHDEIEVMEL
jgi:hypothetical protein